MTIYQKRDTKKARGNIIVTPHLKERLQRVTFDGKAMVTIKEGVLTKLEKEYTLREARVSRVEGFITDLETCFGNALPPAPSLTEGTNDSVTPTAAPEKKSATPRKKRKIKTMVVHSSW